MIFLSFRFYLHLSLLSAFSHFGPLSVIFGILSYVDVKEHEI